MPQQAPSQGGEQTYAHQLFPHGQPPQPPQEHYYQPGPGFVPPEQLADQIPGAVPHGVFDEAYAHAASDGRAVPIPPWVEPKRAGGWNAPAFGMLAIFLVALAMLLIPQYKARQTEAKIQPLVAAVAERDAGARCPRYITTMFSVAGSVAFDENGQASDRTDLTAPVCEGAKFAFTPQGRQELQCLATDGACSEQAIAAIVALNVIAHEAIHLRGELDESRAECSSIGEGERIARVVGLSPDQGRMIAWVHYKGMNRSTPEQYRVHPSWCAPAAALDQRPPGPSPQVRDQLAASVEYAWATLGD